MRTLCGCVVVLLVGSLPPAGAQAVNHTDIVAAIKASVNPPSTAEGAFEVTKRVAWALRAEGAGLLVKTSGENVVPWLGESFSAGRLCYPDGHVIKILSDVPATNGPEWLDNGVVPAGLYRAARDPDGGGGAGPPGPPPSEVPAPPASDAILHRLDALSQQVDAQAAALARHIDAAAAQAAADHAAVRQDIRSFREAVWAYAKPIVKYVLPALTALIVGKQL